jgi:hypothetical protein
MSEEVKNSEEIRDKRLDNLTPFKEGESGNPDGRPKGQRNYATIYREALIKLASLNYKTPDELEEEILSSGLLNARKGDYRFYKDLLDRLHGTPVSRTELTGKDGKDLLPIPLLENLRNVRNNNSPEEGNTTEEED